jgi:hypothetical protein
MQFAAELQTPFRTAALVLLILAITLVGMAEMRLRDTATTGPVGVDLHKANAGFDDPPS